MSIRFTCQKSELLLIFSPDSIEIQTVLDKLEKDEDYYICRCFLFTKKHLRKKDLYENELYFCIGEVQSEYTHIDNEILGIDHDFYFSNEIKLKKHHFVAYRNISILAKIDQVVEQDVYIGGKHSGYIPIDTFEFLIKKFPKTAELDYYAHARIATIVKEFFPKSEIHEIKYKRFLERRERTLASTFSPTIQTAFQENVEIEFQQFNSVRYDLVELLEREQGLTEKVWQEKIHGLLRLLYPKYIAGVREIFIKGVDQYDKFPDFLLVDANGYIDILEIKKPNVQLLTKQSSYRNNYVPVRDLAGAIQQTEKYIYCLNAWGKEGEQNLQKQLAEKCKLSNSVIPKIVNPQGILLLGRSKDFNHQQKTDFELIKRQYKHIAEIMTYDDLLQRIDNIIAALSQELNAM